MVYFTFHMDKKTKQTLFGHVTIIGFVYIFIGILKTIPELYLKHRPVGESGLTILCPIFYEDRGNVPTNCKWTLIGIIFLTIRYWVGYLQ